MSKEITITEDEYKELLHLRSKKEEFTENLMKVHLRVNVAMVEDQRQLQAWTIDSITYPDVESWLNHPMIGDIHHWQSKCVANYDLYQEIKRLKELNQNIKDDNEYLKEELAKSKRLKWWERLLGAQEEEE